MSTSNEAMDLSVLKVVVAQEDEEDTPSTPDVPELSEQQQADLDALLLDYPDVVCSQTGHVTILSTQEMHLLFAVAHTGLFQPRAKEEVRSLLAVVILKTLL